MRYKRLIYPALLLTVLALAIVVVPDALAVETGLDKAAGSLIPKTKDLSSIVGNLLKAVLGFVGTLFLLLMVYAGFLWMTARGDSKKVDQAKQLITGAIIGIVVIASAYAITSFVLQAVSGTVKETPAETPQENAPAGKSDRGGPCTTANDCATNVLECQQGTCRGTQDTFCMSDDECVSGLTCKDQRCEP